MLFEDQHITAIRQGVKTATRRDWDENYNRPTPGVHIAATHLFTSEDEADCYIVVTDVYREPLGDMTHEDARKEGGYDLDDFREAWERINGDDAWDPEQVVDVVEFEYGGRTREEAEAKARELGVDE